MQAVELFGTGKVNGNRATAFRYLPDIDSGPERDAELLFEGGYVLALRTGGFGALFAIGELERFICITNQLRNQAFGSPHTQLLFMDPRGYGNLLTLLTERQQGPTVPGGQRAGPNQLLYRYRQFQQAN